MGEDIKMNAFQEVEDYEYIYVELADGSQAKIIQKLLTIAIVLALMRIMVYIG